MFRRHHGLVSTFAVLVVAWPACSQPAATANPASLWPELVQVDAAKAYQAMRQLAAMPVRTLSYLRDAVPPAAKTATDRSEEHTTELQSLRHLVCRLLLEKKKTGKLAQRKR